MLNANVWAYCLIITLLLARSSFPEAQELSTGDPLKQEYLEVLRLIGNPRRTDVQRGKQHYDEAIQSLKWIIEKEPSFCRGYLRLVEIYKYKSALSDARAYFEGLITTNPKNANAYHGLGLVHHEQGDLQLAIKNYRKGIELGNRCAAIYKDMVGAHNKSHELEKAIDYLNKLARVQENDEDVYYGLGYAYARQKHWEQASCGAGNSIKTQSQFIACLF